VYLLKSSKGVPNCKMEKARAGGITACLLSILRNQKGDRLNPCLTQIAECVLSWRCVFWITCTHSGPMGR
jgi:hypothetical protein